MVFILSSYKLQWVSDWPDIEVFARLTEGAQVAIPHAHSKSGGGTVDFNLSDKSVESSPAYTQGGICIKATSEITLRYLIVLIILLLSQIR